MIQITEPLDGVVRISSEEEGPTLAVIGALHGNEPCGLRAIERLEAELTSGELELVSGSVVLVHGNPEATRQYRRFSDGGADLNRIFDFGFLDHLPEARWSYEHHRALALRPLVDEWTAVLDLHSASFPTAPFAIWPYGSPPLPMLRRMGLEVVTRSWDGLGLPGSQALISVLSQQRRPALAIECGQHEEPEAVDRAYAFARRFLASSGAISEPVPFLTETKVLEMLTAVTKPDDEYRFPR
ncbi:MAG: succinylglutamate desuccinylase/aspartoacylase family protein, partial [Myxococcota bacterium]